MKKILTLLMLICLFLLNSCNSKSQTSTNFEEIIVPEEPHINIKIDSTEIANRLKQKIINKLVFFDKDTLSVPFNYSMKANNKATLLFLWQLGDLVINSQWDNYFSFRFQDEIRFRLETMEAGTMHMVWTDNKLALTMSKLKKDLEDIDEIYYVDSQSLIYRERNSINTIFFEYLEDKKAFAVYLYLDENFWLMKFRDITLQQKLDLAIEHLAVAKQFFKTKKTKVLHDWKAYEKNLNNLNLITINESYLEIKDSVKKPIFNEFIKLQKMDIFVMNLQTDHTQLWQDIQNFYSKKIANIESINFPNFEFIFGKCSINKVEYMDKDAIIVELEDDFDHKLYATIVKTKIQNKDVLLATSNIEGSWVRYNPSKEMNYFYLNMFKHFGTL